MLYFNKCLASLLTYKIFLHPHEKLLGIAINQKDLPLSMQAWVQATRIESTFTKRFQINLITPTLFQSETSLKSMPPSFLGMVKSAQENLAGTHHQKTPLQR